MFLNSGGSSPKKTLRIVSRAYPAVIGVPARATAVRMSLAVEPVSSAPANEPAKINHSD